jgi:hypothetical protein
MASAANISNAEHGFTISPSESGGQAVDTRLGLIQSLAGGLQIALIEGRPRFVQKRFGTHSENHDLGMQRHTGGSQILLDRIRGMKICDCARRNQHQAMTHLAHGGGRLGWRGKRRSILSEHGSQHANQCQRDSRKFHGYFLTMSPATGVPAPA